MGSCGGGCGVRACSKQVRKYGHPFLSKCHTESRRPGQIQTQHRAMPFDSFFDLESFICSFVWANAQIGTRSYFPLCAPIPSLSLPSSSNSYLFQHGSRIYRHSQGPRYGRDDFQAVRAYPNQLPSLLLNAPCCTGNSSVAKSNAKKRPGGRRIPRISLLPSLMLWTMLRMKKTFRLMYVPSK